MFVRVQLSLKLLNSRGVHIPRRVCGIAFQRNNLLNPPGLNGNVQQQRNTTFFNKLTADELWKGVTSVSNAGKKRGRGKGVGKKTSKNLNRGQIIGVGKANILWPGLSAPIIRGREVVSMQQLPKDPERENKLIKLRDSMGVFRPLRIDPIERGWSGTKMPGRSIGPPDPSGDEKFEDFDTKVLELKNVVCMKGIFGRRRRLSSFVVTGNSNGLAGFALAQGVDPRTALRRSKNRAAINLMFIELYNGHTVYHDFFSQFGRTKIFVCKKPEGFGLVCHRAIKTMCEVIGIKDLYAKIEGSTNIQNMTKAFFLGLIRQKTHQEIAEEKKLHVVEFRKENDNFPNVVASPLTCRKPEEISTNEVMDFTQYVMGNRVVLHKKKRPPFYTRLPGWKVHIKKTAHLKNQDKVKIETLVRYGRLTSFVWKNQPRKAKTTTAAE